MLVIGAEGPGSNIPCTWDCSKTLSDYPTVNEYLTLRAGEGEGNEKEERRPTTVTSLPVQVGPPNSHFPTCPSIG